MEYIEFLEVLKTYVQEKVGDNGLVSVHQVLKNNTNRTDSLAILRNGCNMTSSLDLSQAYRQLRAGMSIEEIAGEILEFYEKNSKDGKIDLSFYTDFFKVKDSIACKLINYEKNRYLLERVPHRRFKDLAVVYYCRVDNPLIGKGSILIQNAHMELWGISEEELDHIARKNTLLILPHELIGLSDLLKGVFIIAGTEIEKVNPMQMYVLSNTEKYFGAVNIIFDNVLEAVAAQLESDFYILPSSIHECMILPVSGVYRPEELRQMVHEINEACVAEEEILGENIYHYDRRNHDLVNCTGQN